jgi:ribosomal protein L14E/L6E/L27E|tara:strand:- start:508 stop:681 length:174 start_codon:yes stop_codon:yes gene_type:complete
MKFKDYLKEFESHYNSKNGRTAWEKAEEKYFEKHGKSKYRSYQSFKTMKSRKKNKKI